MCVFCACAHIPACVHAPWQLVFPSPCFPEHLTRRMESPCTSTLLSPETLHSTLTTTERMSEGDRNSGRRAGVMLARCATPSEYESLGLSCHSQNICQWTCDQSSWVCSILPSFSVFAFFFFFCFGLFVLKYHFVVLAGLEFIVILLPHQPYRHVLP